MPDPTQLCFYSGSWVDVLKDAKYRFRFCIHTEVPFPERTTDSLSVTHDCLVEAIAKFQDEVRLPLDEGLLPCFIIDIIITNGFLDVYKIHCSAMDVLVSKIFLPSSISTDSYLGF